MMSDLGVTPNYIQTPFAQLFAGLAAEAGAQDPDGVSAQLVLLYDGAGIAAWMDRDPGAAAAAHAVATALVDAAAVA